jgi:hypothetical protein
MSCLRNTTNAPHGAMEQKRMSKPCKVCERIGHTCTMCKAQIEREKRGGGKRTT